MVTTFCLCFVCGMSWMNLLIAETLSQSQTLHACVSYNSSYGHFCETFAYYGQNVHSMATSLKPLQSEISLVDWLTLKRCHRTKKFVNNCYTNIYLTIFEIFEVKRFFIGAIVKITSNSGLTDIPLFWISTKNNMWSHLLGDYHDGKCGEDRWKIATCRAFNSFCVTDWLTDWLTHSQTDFITCPMLVMYWADNKIQRSCCDCKEWYWEVYVSCTVFAEVWASFKTAISSADIWERTT